MASKSEGYSSPLLTTWLTVETGKDATRFALLTRVHHVLRRFSMEPDINTMFEYLTILHHIIMNDHYEKEF